MESWNTKGPEDACKNLSSSRADSKLPSNSFKIGNIHYIILNYFVGLTTMLAPCVLFIWTFKCKFIFFFSVENPTELRPKNAVGESNESLFLLRYENQKNSQKTLEPPPPPQSLKILFIILFVILCKYLLLNFLTVKTHLKCS